MNIIFTMPPVNIVIFKRTLNEEHKLRNDSLISRTIALFKQISIYYVSTNITLHNFTKSAFLDKLQHC